MAKKTLEQQIENLSVMTQRGFENVGKEFKEMREYMDGRFGKIEDRLDRIEFYVNGHERRIEVVEDKTRLLGNKVGLKFK